jgi:hypothetical protein
MGTIVDYFEVVYRRFNPGLRSSMEADKEEQ